jgi:hypothetical protein
MNFISGGVFYNYHDNTIFIIIRRSNLFVTSYLVDDDSPYSSVYVDDETISNECVLIGTI